MEFEFSRQVGRSVERKIFPGLWRQILNGKINQSVIFLNLSEFMVVLIFSGNEKNALKWKENFSLDKKRRFGANHGKFFLDYFVVNPLVP